MNITIDNKKKPLQQVYQINMFDIWYTKCAKSFIEATENIKCLRYSDLK